jgi:hypothetical protein
MKNLSFSSFFVTSFIVLNLFAVAALAEDDNCEYYLTFSSKKHGRKIVAGKDLPAESVLFFDPSVFAPTNWTGRNMLSKYVFSSADSEVAMILLGPEPLMNHSPTPNTNHFWDDENPPFPKDFPEPRYGNNKAFTSATRNIVKGEEIFGDYGPTWFVDHHLEEINLVDNEPENESEKKKENRVCLSGFQMRESKFPGAGHGLFSTKSYKKDDLITVSPAIFLASWDLYNSLANSAVVNYCFYKPGSAVALLPVGFSVMMNHYQTVTSTGRGPEDEEEDANGPNVYVKWFNWETMQPEDTPWFGTDGRDLMSLIDSAFAPLDLGFYAARDIAEGEELTIDYGQDWMDTYQTIVEDSSAPFQHWIGGIDDLFPPQWQTTGNCEDSENHPLFCYPDLEAEIEAAAGEARGSNQTEASGETSLHVEL